MCAAERSTEWNRTVRIVVSPQTKKPTISNVRSLDLWSSKTGQIRTCRGKAPPSCLRKTVLLLKSPTGAFVASQTQTFFSAISRQSVLKPDGLGAVFVVERDQHPVIVQKNGIYKNFNQCFSLFFLRNIELSKFHQPESDEILMEDGLLQFLQSAHLSGFPTLPAALLLSGCTSRPRSPSSDCPAFC